MRKHRSVSFIKTFETQDEAEGWIDKIIGPAIVVHLCRMNGKGEIANELFAVCDQNGIDAMQEELNATKEKANV